MTKIIRNVPNHPMVVQTGKFTGRSPRDRYMVKQDPSKKYVEWGERNKEISHEHYVLLRDKILNYLQSKTKFTFKGNVISEKKYSYKINLETEEKWYTKFAANMFRQDNFSTSLNEITILHAPFFHADPGLHGVENSNFVIINFEDNIILIGGTGYAGEIKKSVFTLLNYHLIDNDILPMHCSANFDKENGTTIFFGLSGTGKTTLSSDASKELIGDDEHGWTPHNVFNLEGGCYAKVIGLDQKKEPEIYQATHSPDAIIENVIIDSNGSIDFEDKSITENTRSCYPLSSIDNVFSQEKSAPSPTTIIMLTCDAFGVLPPVSKLTIEQAIFHFVSGYTAKIAGTEAEIQEPQATFSACFGAPFMPRHIMDYANLLLERIEKHRPRCWLINTGWWGGAYGSGKRIDLTTTRSILKKSISDSFEENCFVKSKYYNLSFPSHLDFEKNISLNPAEQWSDQTEYEKASKNLLLLFKNNLDKMNLPKNAVIEKGSIFSSI